MFYRSRFEPTTNKPRHLKQVLLACILVLILSGCASIDRLSQKFGSNEPNLRLKHQHTGEPATTAPVASQGTWWAQFNEPELNKIITAALNSNLNIRAIAARLEAAAKASDAANASLFPTLTLNATRQENTVKGVSIQGANTNNRGYFTGASAVATYELDWLGRLKNTRDAAQFTEFAARQELEAAKVSLAAQTATTWVQWLAASKTQQLLAEEAERFEANLKSVELRFRMGAAPASDVLQQRQLLESAKGNLALAVANQETLQSALAVLMGQMPADLELQPQDLPKPVEIAGTGIDSNLIRRRPDVNQAYNQMLAADQQLAAAVLAQFPQLSLRASFSDQARSQDLLFDTWVRNLSLNLVAPIIDGGARKAEAERQNALLKAAIANYQQACLNALADIDNALTQERQQKVLLASLEQQLTLSELSEQRLLAGYKNGTVNYLALLNAQQTTSTLKRNVLNAKQQYFANQVAVFRAVSGPLSLTEIASPTQEPALSAS